MLGSNVSCVGGLSKGIENGEKWGCECIQIYLTLSRRWNLPDLKEEKVIEFKNAWDKSSIKEVVAHIPFLVNLASPNLEILERSIARIYTELEYAKRFGVKYLVSHIGYYKNTSRKIGLNKIIINLNKIYENLEKDCPMILIETMSGQRTALGSSFKEIKYILDNLYRPDLVGVCLDTAHIFQKGYNIIGYKGYETIMNEFDKVIGIDKIKVIHLNDSKTELASKNDKHSIIGKGRIGLAFFHALMRDNRFLKIPKIIEIPKRDIDSIKSLELLKRLRNKVDLIKQKNTSLIDDFL
jgi:deoxyribonuclease-4